MLLALVFNVTNVIGFTYACASPYVRNKFSTLTLLAFRDRDAKQKWAKGAASSGWNMGMGGIGGQIITGVMKNSVGKVFG